MTIISGISINNVVISKRQEHWQMLRVNLEHQILSNFRDVVETINSNEDSLQSHQTKKVKDKR